MNKPCLNQFVINKELSVRKPIVYTSQVVASCKDNNSYIYINSSTYMEPIGKHVIF